MSNKLFDDRGFSRQDHTIQQQTGQQQIAESAGLYVNPDMASRLQQLQERAATVQAQSDCSYVLYDRPFQGSLAPFGGHDTARGPLGSCDSLDRHDNNLTRTYDAACMADFNATVRAPSAPAPQAEPVPQAPDPNLQQAACPKLTNGTLG